jgi:hypothetical protein
MPLHKMKRYKNAPALQEKPYWLTLLLRTGFAFGTCILLLLYNFVRRRFPAYETLQHDTSITIVTTPKLLAKF